MKNQTMQAAREFIRAPFAWPGGYPKTLIMHDGETLCPACARENYRQISDSTRHNSRDGWQAVGIDIHWEGAPLVCAHCSTETENAYGDPAETCNCDDYSWHGESHASACPFAGQPMQCREVTQ